MCQFYPGLHACSCSLVTCITLPRCQSPAHPELRCHLRSASPGPRYNPLQGHTSPPARPSSRSPLARAAPFPLLHHGPLWAFPWDPLASPEAQAALQLSQCSANQTPWAWPFAQGRRGFAAEAMLSQSNPMGVAPLSSAQGRRGLREQGGLPAGPGN